jgi:hypothetical protein
MVLRSCDSRDYFTLVGEAYIHGIMDREAFKYDLCDDYIDITLE